MKRRVPTLAELPKAVSAGLVALAKDAKSGPFGCKSLSQLVADHLPVFAELQRFGGHWPEIVKLLEECGITNGDDPLADDVLRATYSRAKRDARNRCNEPKQAETTRGTTKRYEPGQAEPEPTAAESVQPVRRAPHRSKAERGEAKRKPGRRANGDAAPTDTVKPDAPAANHPDIINTRATHYMCQARATHDPRHIRSIPWTQ